MRPRRAPAKPAYDFIVLEKHRNLDAEGARRYRQAVSSAARKAIPTPITSPDVIVEIFYSTQTGTPQADIVDILKPTLEALEGIAYLEDSQVQSVTATVFDRDQHLTKSRRGEQIGPFLVSAGRHALLIRIFSESHIKAEAAKSGTKASAGWLRGAAKRGAKIRGDERSKVLRS